jgi:hypothetical protein
MSSLVVAWLRLLTMGILQLPCSCPHWMAARLQLTLSCNSWPPSHACWLTHSIGQLNWRWLLPALSFLASSPIEIYDQDFWSLFNASVSYAVGDALPSPLWTKTSCSAGKSTEGHLFNGGSKFPQLIAARCNQVLVSNSVLKCPSSLLVCRSFRVSM